MSDTARTQAFADALNQLEQGDAQSLVDQFATEAELVRPEQDRSAPSDAETFWEQYQSQFSDITTEFHRIVEEGNEGILEWKSRGTLQSGQPIEYAGVSLLTFTDDKVSRFATYYDTSAFLASPA